MFIKYYTNSFKQVTQIRYHFFNSKQLRAPKVNKTAKLK